jgi:hypothetical protein
VAAAALRLAAGQRDVNRPDLVDGKALADRLDTTEGGQQPRQFALLDAEHLDVDVLRHDAEQPVADPAADDYCASAACARRFREGARQVEGVGGIHVPMLSHTLLRECVGLKPRRHRSARSL